MADRTSVVKPTRFQRVRDRIGGGRHSVQSCRFKISIPRRVCSVPPVQLAPCVVRIPDSQAVTQDPNGGWHACCFEQACRATHRMPAVEATTVLAEHWPFRKHARSKQRACHPNVVDLSRRSANQYRERERAASLGWAEHRFGRSQTVAVPIGIALSQQHWHATPPTGMAPCPVVRRHKSNVTRILPQCRWKCHDLGTIR